MNDFCKILEKNKDIIKTDRLLNINTICNNPNIRIDFIKRNLDIEWSWNILTANEKAISLEDIINNPTLPWSPITICRRNDITLNFFRDNKSLFSDQSLERNLISYKGTIAELEELGESQWNFSYISHNQNLTNEFIRRHIEFPWNWVFLFSNKNIDYKLFIDKNGELFFLDNMLPDIFRFPLEMIKDYYIPRFYKNPEFWLKLSTNMYLNKKFIEEYIECPWNWKSFSYHSFIDAEFISKYINELWNFDNLSSNPKITMELVKKHLDKPWNWLNLTKNPSIKFKDIQDNLHLPWDFNTWIFRNPNINFEKLLLLPVNKTNYFYYILNPNLRFEEFEKLKKFNKPYANYDFITYISLNEFSYDKNLMLIAKNIIVRNLRKYRLKYRLKHLSKQSYVVDEIKFKPNFGIKYFEIKSELDEITCEFIKDI